MTLDDFVRGYMERSVLMAKQVKARVLVKLFVDLVRDDLDVG